MKRFNHPASWLLGALLALGTGSTYASHVLGARVSGTVTAVTANSVTIDGKTYRIHPGSPAAQALSQVQVGKPVTLSLDGSPSASTTHVRLIQPAAKP